MIKAERMRRIVMDLEVCFDWVRIIGIPNRTKFTVLLRLKLKYFLVFYCFLRLFVNQRKFKIGKVISFVVMKG